MAKNGDIVITAGLNIEASADLIKSQIGELESALKNKNVAVKIGCLIDTNNLSGIKTQLGKLTKDLKIEIDSESLKKVIDSGATKLDIGDTLSKKVTNKTVAAFNDAFNMVGKMGEIAKKDFNAQTKQMLQDLKDAWKNGLTTGDIKPYYDALDKLGQRISDFSRGDIKQLKENIAEIRREFTDGSKISVGSTLMGWLDYATGYNSVSREYLDAIYGKGNYTISLGNAGYDTLLRNPDDGEADRIINAAKKIIEYQEKIKSVGWGLDEIQETGATIQEIDEGIEDTIRKLVGLPQLEKSGSWIDINVDDSIQKMEQLADKASDAVHWTDEWETIFDEKDIANLEAGASNIEKVGEAATNATVSLEGLNKAADRMPDIGIGENTKATLEGAKSTLNEFFEKNKIDGQANRVKRAVEDTTGELQRFYVQVEKGDKSVETLTYALNEQGDAYTYLGKTIREADNSTDFRRKDVSTQWQIQAENLIKFANNADKAGLASTSLKGDIQELFEALNKANPQVGGDTSSMNSFLDKFDIAKAKYQALKAEIGKENVAQKIDDNLISLSNRIEKTSGAFTEWSNNNKKVAKSNKEIGDSINETTGDLYTYSEKWAELNKRLADFKAKAKAGTLTEGDIVSFKHLNEEINAFKKNADAAGLTISAFFRNMRTQLSYVIMQWVSIQGAIRILKSLATEVVNVDTAMTELRKVTTATDEEFNKFSKSAGATAKELGASISDVINATATFSRLGYSLPDAEELGKVATIFKNVGDGITETEAAEDLVSTMKAFNIEAKDAISIVDKFNSVGNSFAISSGGIGEALKRSASALAAGNNDLSESIALITTANTVAQDPTTVGQGIKTVSLRLRSTKTELEEMGEDAEGAAENISKLRDQMLALTGVDIQFDDTTYKSTYQILLEISKVWGKLDDLSRSSVLEQLFGKRQSNIGAAILENGQLLEDVYANAENSMGSAMAEQEEYAKSIQKSLDSLKASFQDLAQTIINSDLFKGLVDGASKLLDIVTKLMRTFGTLPTLLAGISAAMYATGKGKGFLPFGTIRDEADKTTKHLTLFGTQIKNINTADTKGFARITTALKNIQWQAILTEAAAMAANAALTAGISWVVSKGIQWIDDYIHKEENAAKAAEEARKQREESIQKGAENAKTYEREASSIQDLANRYIKLISTTGDLSNSKDELIDIQKQLTDAYDGEKTGIDLVNKSLEENIRLMDEQEQKAKKKYLRENAEEIAAAKEYFEIDEKTGAVSGSWKAAPISSSSEVVGKSYIKSIKEYLEKEYPDLVKNAQEYLDVNPLSGKINFGMEIISGLTPEETYKTAQALSEAYQYAADLRDNNDVDESSILGVNEAWVKRIENAYEVLKKAGEIKEDIDSWGVFENTDDFQKYNNLINEAVSITQTLNDDDLSVGERFKASLELDKVKSSLDEIAEKYPDVADKIKSKTDELGTTFKNVTNTVETAKEAWVKSLDEAQKGVLSDVDKITSAMEKLYAGEGIDQKSAWEILNMDDDKVLSNIKIVDGKYVFDLEQIVSLKDQIIQKEIEQRKESIATAKEGAKQAKDNIALAKQRMLAVTLERGKAYASGNTDRVAELNAEYKSFENSIQKDTDALNGFNYTIRNETLYVEQLSGSLGDLTDTADVLQAMIKRLQKELEALNKKADGMLKAQEHVIDGIIDKYEDELGVLEKQQDSLEEQLDVLEKQKDELDDIIDKYKTVSNYVQDTISKQIEEIEDNRKEIEDYYDNLIDKLKTENEEREDAIEYEKKLAALNNAKNNKVRSYDQARGWTYEANKDAIQDAQNDLDSFENEQAIKELEKQKEEATAGFDERIKELEAYSKEWKDAIDGITEAENDLIATEILGSDWREKIAKRDEETLTKFKTAFSKYNTDLAKLTKNEIENLKSSIQAVKDEVTEKKKQIQVWKDYKTELTSAASDIKNGLEDYVKYLDTVKLTENSTNADRLTNLQNFKTSYKLVVDEITSKNAQIEETTKQYDTLIDSMKKVMNVTGGTGNVTGDIGNALASAINFFAEKIKELKDVLDPLKTAFKIVAEKAEKIKDTDKGIEDILGFAGGGAADYTGLAMLHGTKQKSETIFTAAQSKKLLGLVEAMPDYSKLLSTPPRVEANKTTTNNIAGATFSIANMTVVANNPEQFEAQMKRYWQTKLTESKVY